MFIYLVYENNRKFYKIFINYICSLGSRLLLKRHIIGGVILCLGNIKLMKGGKEDDEVEISLDMKHAWDDEDANGELVDFVWNTWRVMCGRI